ncbi:MAG TPA: hypothetical protein PKI01_07620 [Bacteroidales bacterium]|nr:hypothetical protein [Bacteroidales bacterium]
MKKINFILILVIIISLSSVSCEKMVSEPNMPSSYDGRTVDDQGTLYVSDRNIILRAWDNGNIDGDVITLVVNDHVILSNYTLDGISNKKELDVKLDNNGYNYILLFVNNEGSELSCTAALTIDDGTGEQDLVLSSDLTYCGAMSIYVQ